MEDCQYFPKSKSKNSAYIIIYINKYFGTYINTNFGLHLSLVSPSSPFQFWLWFHPKFFPWILRFLKLPNSSFQDCDFWKQLSSNYFSIKKSIQKEENRDIKRYDKSRDDGWVIGRIRNCDIKNERAAVSPEAFAISFVFSEFSFLRRYRFFLFPRLLLVS